MKKAMILNLVAFLCFLVGVAFAQDDIKKYPSCNFCGMDRDKYAHSRVYTEAAGGVQSSSAAQSSIQTVRPLHDPNNFEQGMIKDRQIVIGLRALPACCCEAPGRWASAVGIT